MKPPRVVAVVPGVIPSVVMNVVKPLTILDSWGEIRFRPLLEGLASRSDFQTADVAVFCRNADPKGERILDWLAAAAVPYVYDLDDNLFQVPRDTELGRYYQLPDVRSQLSEYIARAALVRVYSDQLRSLISSMNPATVRVDGYVDLRVLRGLPRRLPSAEVRIVYATSRKQDALAEIFRPALERLLEKDGDTVRVTFWGGLPPASVVGPQVEHWQVDLNHDRYLRRLASSGFAVGLAPLLNDEFHRSKANAKFREYGACRIAGIYSDVEVYSKDVGEQRAGLLVANDPEAWWVALDRLVHDAPLREKIAQAAWEKVRAEYSIESALGVWASQIQQVSGSLGVGRTRTAVRTIQVAPIADEGGAAPPGSKEVARKAGVSVKRVVGRARAGLALTIHAIALARRWLALKASMADVRHDWRTSGPSLSARGETMEIQVAERRALAQVPSLPSVTHAPASIGSFGRADLDQLHRFYGSQLVRHQRRVARRGALTITHWLADVLLRARWGLGPPGSTRDVWLARMGRWAYPMMAKTLIAGDPGYQAFLRSAQVPMRELRRQAVQSRAMPSPLWLQLHTRLRTDDPGTIRRLGIALRSQSYPFWIWTVSVGASHVESARAVEVWSTLDARVRVSTGLVAELPTKELAGAGSEIATEYLGDLDPSYDLPRHSLFRFAEAIREIPPPDLVYADVDVGSSNGARGEAMFKPDWSPATLLSEDLLTGLVFIPWTMVESLRTEWTASPPESISDKHFWMAEKAQTVRHIPEVMTHLQPAFAVREGPTLPRREPGERLQAIQRHLARSVGPEAAVMIGLGGEARITWEATTARRVSIVIPSRDQPAVLHRCLLSLSTSMTQSIAELIVVDTGSRDPGVEDLYREWQQLLPLRIVRMQGEFNFAAACNVGARDSEGELVLFLNNDTEALVPDWLDRMVQWFEFSDVGVVGAKLLSPDGYLQHAGVIVGMGGLASHLFYGEPELVTGIFGSDQWYRDLSAVTGACMLVSRQAFDALGGFDEGFVLIYQDIDFCLRARERGWRIVYTPDARLIHLEGISHQRRIPRADFVRAYQRWTQSGCLDGDPFFNANLSYMSPTPIFRWSAHDNPATLARRLIRRLPRKEVLQLPDDLR